MASAIKDRARTLITERMKARDATLDADLRRISERMSRAEDNPEDLLRLQVKLRALCESDLSARAGIIWQSLHSAHQDISGRRSRGLEAQLREELNGHVRDGSLVLAEALRDHAKGLSPVFSGSRVIDASWLSRQRKEAAEALGPRIAAYVDDLSWPLSTLITRLLRGH